MKAYLCDIKWKTRCIAIVIAMGGCALIDGCSQRPLHTAAEALKNIDRSKMAPVTTDTLKLNGLREAAGLRKVTAAWQTAACKMIIMDGPHIEVLLDDTGAVAKVLLRDIGWRGPTDVWLHEYEVAGGKLNGKSATWIGNPSALFVTETYQNNRLHGQTVYFRADRTPICACEFRDNEPWTGRTLQRDGFERTTWDVSYLDGKHDGEERYLRPDGTPERIRWFKTGVLHGPQETYYEGRLCSQELYVNGTMRTRKSFYPNGLLEWEEHADEKGQHHGRRIKLDQLGELEVEENYKNGKFHGRVWEKGHPEGWYWEGKGCGGRAGFESRQR